MPSPIIPTPPSVLLVFKCVCVCRFEDVQQQSRMPRHEATQAYAAFQIVGDLEGMAECVRIARWPRYRRYRCVLFGVVQGDKIIHPKEWVVVFFSRGGSEAEMAASRKWWWMFLLFLLKSDAQILVFPSMITDDSWDPCNGTQPFFLSAMGLSQHT